METCGHHGDKKDLDQSKYNALPKCKARFLDTQITGAASMLQMSNGCIPIAAERAQDPGVAKAYDSLKSVKTYGGYLVDVTGFGKIETALLFACQQALYADHSSGHRPQLVVAPNGAVLNQWQKQIADFFGDVSLIISNDDRPSEARFLHNWVSSTAMREAPNKLDNWPVHLRYVWD